MNKPTHLDPIRCISFQSIRLKIRDGESTRGGCDSRCLSAIARGGSRARRRRCRTSAKRHQRIESNLIGSNRIALNRMDVKKYENCRDHMNSIYICILFTFIYVYIYIFIIMLYIYIYMSINQLNPSQ